MGSACITDCVTAFAAAIHDAQSDEGQKQMM
jgi:hypothetical protein